MFACLLFLYFYVISPGMGVPASDGGDGQWHLVVHTDGLCGLGAMQHHCPGTSQQAKFSEWGPFWHIVVVIYIHRCKFYFYVGLDVLGLALFLFSPASFHMGPDSVVGCSSLCSGPFHPRTFGKGHRPLGWSMPWHIVQVRLGMKFCPGFWNSILYFLNIMKSLMWDHVLSSSMILPIVIL